MKKQGSFLNFLIKKGLPPEQDRVSGLPLQEPVTIYEDGYGIPHIYAEHERDAMASLGYLHARDRLWQMETLRRYASGRLAEIAGPSMVDTDHFTRLAGFQGLHNRALKHLDDRNTSLYQAYIDGINGYIDLCGKKLPLEFTTLKLEPEPFTPENAGGALPINAWYLQTNYLEEVLALAAKGNMTSEIWNELFPSYPGTKLPGEEFFTKYGSVEVGELLPGALGFYSDASSAVGNSNVWVHGSGKEGAPLLANDPHLGMLLPQVWYFCHLHAPGLNVCGGTLPGMPAIVIGRTEHVAWGMTNVMTDCCDLYMLRVDPERPTSYKLGRKELEMTEEQERIEILGGGHRDITIYRTQHGPVITELRQGVEAAAVLKWYGTLGDDSFDDTTFQGFFALNRAASKNEFLDAAELIASVGQNIVYADTGGNIGWYATGRCPKRKGYSGRVPADGSSGKCDWKGFYPPGKNPGIENPENGYFVNSNNKSADERTAKRMSYSWGAPYRHDRIEELLSQLTTPEPMDFNVIQKDIYSKRAERIVPVLTGFSYADPDAVLASEMLKIWDYVLRADSAGPLIFNIFRSEFCKTLLPEYFGKYLPVYVNQMDIFYPGIDHLLISYPEHQGKSALLTGGKELQALCEESLAGTIAYIRKTQGGDPEKWSWGKFHAYRYRHPGAAGRLSSWLLNRGPYPASGGTDSVNLAFYCPVNPEDPPEKQYEVTAIPSLRMIISLGDIDENYFIGPLGQCGMPGFPHYDDMVDPWLENRQTKIPLSQKGAAEISVRKQMLEGNG